MNYTKVERIRLLQGENNAAEALATMIKAAVDGEHITRESVQQELLHAAESWMALREQRMQAEQSDSPPEHIFN